MAAYLKISESSCMQQQSAACRRRQIGRACAAAKNVHLVQQTQQQNRISPVGLLNTMLSCHLAPADDTSTSCAQSQALLDCVYDDIDNIFYSKGGFIIPNKEKQAIEATGSSASYGEIEAGGVDTLLRYLALDSSSVFVDLGSGRGRAVLQVALHSPVRRAIGIELSASRLEQAEMALEHLQQHGCSLRPVEFRLDDLSKCNLEDGTHFYLCSTAFGAGICRSIAERLQASPNFQALIASRQLPSQPYLYKVGEVPCDYSFNGNGRAYIYVKSLNPAEAPAAVLSRMWCKDGICWLPGLSQQQLGLSIDEPLAAATRQYVHLHDKACHNATSAIGTAAVTDTTGHPADVDSNV